MAYVPYIDLKMILGAVAGASGAAAGVGAAAADAAGGGSGPLLVLVGNLLEKQRLQLQSPSKEVQRSLIAACIPVQAH